MTPNKPALILHGCCWSVVRTSIPRTKIKIPRHTMLLASGGSRLQGRSSIMEQTRAQRRVGAIPTEQSISREILLLNHFLVQIDINAKNKYGNTPLHITCLYGKLEVARMLFDHGATANVENEEGQTPLHLVSRGIYDSEQTGVDIAQLLLERGADVNSKDKNQDTPLYNALCEWRLEIARMLLDHGANASGWCNSHRAKYFMRILTPKSFPSARVDVNANNKYRNTPLHRTLYDASAV